MRFERLRHSSAKKSLPRSNAWQAFLLPARLIATRIQLVSVLT